MIVWLNGTFGAGKTTTAKELTALLPDARIFDSEYVGLLLRHLLGSVPVDDFQDQGCGSRVRGLLRDVQAAPRCVLVSRHRTPL